MIHEELEDKFNLFSELRHQLYNLCSKYVKENNIRTEEGCELSDFQTMRGGKVALFFVDAEGEPMLTYHTVDIKTLLCYVDDKTFND